MAEEPGQSDLDSMSMRAKGRRDTRREIEERHAARDAFLAGANAPLPPPDPFLVDALEDARRDAQSRKRRRGGAGGGTSGLDAALSQLEVEGASSGRPRARPRPRGGAAGPWGRAAARGAVGAKKRWLHERGYSDATPKDHDGDARRALSAVQLGTFSRRRGRRRGRAGAARLSARPSRRSSATI